MADLDGLQPGPRDHLVTRALETLLQRIGGEFREDVALDPAEGPERLARHAMAEIARQLAAADETADEQVIRLNRLLRWIVPSGDDWAQTELVVPAKVLSGVKARSPLGQPVDLPPLPATPFSQSDLLVNAEGQPNIGSELKAELATADSVDLICAFVIWTGVRHLREPLAEVKARGGRVRVITTTYMGTTERRAVDELFKLGAEIRVAFDARTTKLHAKAWLLERASGLTTAFVGSSNLSHSALFDGLEWNVRLSSMDAAHVIDRVRMMFESHWASEHFELYDPAVNGEELQRALDEYDKRSLGETTISFAGLDVRPYPHQQRMLDALMVERDRHDRHRNLVVAATGTGKTVVAALDYRQLIERHGDLSLLFVAHRQEILKQSLRTYQAVLHRGDFGEIHGAGRTAAGRHVFAMIQSLQEARIREIAPDAFHVVVVDEFHHTAADSYDRLLNHLQPRELLGLTATPERLDGRDVTEWFDYRIAVELRLWEAVDQGFLVPFQYFGVADGTDLRQLTWRRGGYVTSELSLYLTTGDDHRVTKLLEAIRRIVLDPGRMRALGFCVSKEHARYMARKFTEAGLDSIALTGDDSGDVRDQGLADLKAGRLRCVFSVEVLGEGVDVPDVDTVLLLRPTASATVFTQQLGRGLRRAHGKSSLTVIDLIGQQHREFRFDDRLKAILDARRGKVLKQVEDEFPFLPAGCTIDLDRQSREIILDSLKSAVRRSRWSTLVEDLKREQDGIRLVEFLSKHDLRLEDIYKGGRSWTQLKRDACHSTVGASDPEFERETLRALSRVTHVDDPERVAFYGSVLREPEPPAPGSLDLRQWRLITMLAWNLGSGSRGFSSLDDFLLALWLEDDLRQELTELLERLDSESSTRGRPSHVAAEIPLVLHARYTRADVLAALAIGEGVKPPPSREGLTSTSDGRYDAFFVDLQKTERDYSPTTMYRDYAINRELFHWESQSTQAPNQPRVRRWIEHQERGGGILLFVRDKRRSELGTQPFTFLGPATYVDHRGERPVAFTWKLPEQMPEELFEVARSVAAA